LPTGFGAGAHRAGAGQNADQEREWQLRHLKTENDMNRSIIESKYARARLGCIALACCCLMAAAFLGSSRHATGQTQMELNQQEGAKYDKADRELNVVFRHLLTITDKSSVKPLKAAERAWIAYRDAEADYESSKYEGGSIQPLIYETSLYDSTIQRTKQLKAIIKEEESL
jgi:uncharacterized protein YecT (DUF1311 family)